MNKMGGLESMLELIPGMKGQVSEDDIDKQEIEREKAIIRSMTYAERENYLILGPTRRRRIAKGSGTHISDVNRLIKKFEKSRLMMRKLTRNKKYQAEMLKQMVLVVVYHEELSDGEHETEEVRQKTTSYRIIVPTPRETLRPGDRGGRTIIPLQTKMSGIKEDRVKEWLMKAPSQAIRFAICSTRAACR